MSVGTHKLIAARCEALVNVIFRTSSEMTFKPSGYSVYHLFSSHSLLMCLLLLLQQRDFALSNNIWSVLVVEKK